MIPKSALEALKHLVEAIEYAHATGSSLHPDVREVREAKDVLLQSLEPTEARVEVTYNAKQQAFPASSLQTGGLTKREYMALELHKALVTGWAVEIGLKRTDATFSDHAVTLADSLLADLEKEHD